MLKIIKHNSIQMKCYLTELSSDGVTNQWSTNMSPIGQEDLLFLKNAQGRSILHSISLVHMKCLNCVY